MSVRKMCIFPVVVSDESAHELSSPFCGNVLSNRECIEMASNGSHCNVYDKFQFDQILDDIHPPDS